MVDVNFPTETCVYCGQNRHIRKMEMVADTYDEVEDAMKVRLVGKYNICEECLEYLDRILQCGVNLREHVAKVTKVTVENNFEPTALEEPEKQIDNKTKNDKVLYGGYKKFAIVKNSFEMPNYVGWDLLEIIKDAEVDEIPESTERYTINAADNVCLQSGGQKIRRRYTHYLMGLSHNDSLKELRSIIANLNTANQQVNEFNDTLNKKNEAISVKIKELTEMNGNLMQTVRDLEVKVDQTTNENITIAAELFSAKDKIKELERQLVECGAIRNIDLGSQF